MSDELLRQIIELLRDIRTELVAESERLDEVGAALTAMHTELREQTEHLSWIRGYVR